MEGMRHKSTGVHDRNSQKKILYFILVKYKFNSEFQISFSIIILKVYFYKNHTIIQSCLSIRIQNN